MLHAQLVGHSSDDVVYFAHTQEPTPAEADELAARGIHVIHGEVARLVIEDDHLTGVQLADGKVVPRAAVFVRPINTLHPDNFLAAQPQPWHLRPLQVSHQPTSRSAAA